MAYLDRMRSALATTRSSTMAVRITAILISAILSLSIVSATQATLVDSIGGVENWFRADKGVQVTATLVDQWDDQSGNSDHAVPISTGKPTLASNVFNGLPAVRFVKSASVDDLSFTGVSHSSSDDFSFFIVVKPADSFAIGTDLGFFLGSTATVNDDSKIGPYSTSLFLRRIGDAGAANNGIWPNPNPVPPESHIIHLQRNTANSMTSGFDGATPGESATVTQTSQLNRIGGPTELSTTQDFPGDIAELVFFGDTLNTAERVIMENYLSSKYAIALNGSGAQDIYSGDTPGNFNFDFDVFGIGRDDSGNGGTLTQSSSGAVSLEITGGLDDLEFIAGGFQFNDDSTQGLLYLDETNLNGNETIVLAFDLTELGLSADAFELYYHVNDPDALTGTGLFGTVNGSSVEFTLGSTLQDGFFSIETANITVPVPEPSLLILLGCGSLALVLSNQRRKSFE